MEHTETHLSFRNRYERSAHVLWGECTEAPTGGGLVDIGSFCSFWCDVGTSGRTEVRRVLLGFFFFLVKVIISIVLQRDPGQRAVLAVPSGQ